MTLSFSFGYHERVGVYLEGILWSGKTEFNPSKTKHWDKYINWKSHILYHVVNPTQKNLCFMIGYTHK